ncbi:MAG: F0F1 ATP synthase subunit B [Bacteroidales bacterium]|jgi:F-type H+-transporting ATPase subunit b|nr:F0F1 ATP synthase subunit B [Bacteroidales bacterium]
MELVKPEIGLIFWMTLSFLILLFILKKAAWKPVLKMLTKREDDITKALNEANLAKEQMKQLTIDNEKLLAQAKDERDAILSEARKISQKMYDDAKIKASEEGQRIIAAARENIDIEKQKAVADIKNMIAEFSLEIAEKVLQSELSDKNRQKDYIHQQIEHINLS